MLSAMIIHNLQGRHTWIYEDMHPSLLGLKDHSFPSVKADTLNLCLFNACSMSVTMSESSSTARMYLFLFLLAWSF